MINIRNEEAILNLRPNAQWALRGDELEWLDTEQSQPTDEEIQTEIARLTYVHGINQYQRDRLYPPMEDQLDAIFHGGVDAWKSDIQAVKDAAPKVLPNEADQAAFIKAHVDQWRFDTQLAAYKQALARLAQYIVADGREELTEMQPTGEQVFNEDTMEMDDVMQEVVVQSYIEPLEPTVEQTVYSDDIDAAPTVETVTNPLIVADEAEREAARNVIAVTPNEVKEYK
jgi:hypothetical protein